MKKRSAVQCTYLNTAIRSVGDVIHHLSTMHVILGLIKMTDVKDDLIKNNNTVTDSKTIGEGRFGAWLENVQDWGISRNRYWGTP